MVVLCFVLDLRTLSPPLLRELKQCLLQLANHYAISTGRRDKQSEILTDRIALCYLLNNTTSSSLELKIAYSPRGNFSLRDFHHAVSNLPTDGYLPELANSVVTTMGGGDVVFAKLLSEEVIFSWGGKDISRKVIFISTCLLENFDSARKILMDAADKCVSVEFVLLEQESCQLNNMSEDVQKFTNTISDLENCSLQTHLLDTWVMCGLVKRWHQELKDDLEEPLQAIFHFKNHLIGSTNQIFCNLIASMNHMIDGFSPCQTCRCHGVPLDGSGGRKVNRPYLCPITRQELGTCNLIENAVRVGDQTILFLPSFQNCPNSQRICSPISFSVIERTNLGSLSEGLIVGSSYMVTPSAYQEIESTSDECDKSELNTQIFQALCRALHSLDQGLICSSNCNLETKMDATLQCFYILQPSDNGPMLLRRLAGSEEILPFPDVFGLVDFAVPEGMKDSIGASLSRMELRDYNPLMHERGFHPKLNLLVKESLQFGSIPPKRNEITPGFSSPRADPPATKNIISSTTVSGQEEDNTPQPTQMRREVKSADCIAEEWEQLIVDEEGKIYSPTCISRPKIKCSVLSPVDVNKQLDEKTSRILERLEGPRQTKTKGSGTSGVCDRGRDMTTCVAKKKPLVPFPANHGIDQNQSQGGSSSQPIRPNFQRLKRKQR